MIIMLIMMMIMIMMMMKVCLTDDEMIMMLIMTMMIMIMMMMKVCLTDDGMIRLQTSVNQATANHTLRYDSPSYHDFGTLPTLMDPFENNTVEFCAVKMRPAE